LTKSGTMRMPPKMIKASPSVVVFMPILHACAFVRSTTHPTGPGSPRGCGIRRFWTCWKCILLIFTCLQRMDGDGECALAASRSVLRACMVVPFKPLDAAIADRIVAAVTPLGGRAYRPRWPDRIPAHPDPSQDVPQNSGGAHDRHAIQLQLRARTARTSDSPRARQLPKEELTRSLCGTPRTRPGNTKQKSNDDRHFIRLLLHRPSTNTPEPSLVEHARKPMRDRADHSAGKGAAWPEATCSVLPRRIQVCSRSR